jgi:hypothetical protein
MMMDLERLFERLAAFPIRSAEQGTVVLAAGSSTGQLLFLIHGAVDVMKDQWHITRITQPGAVFGDMAALRRRPHAADVIAAAPSSFFVVADGAAFLAAEPMIALHVATVQCARLDAGNGRLIAARQEIAAKGREHRSCVAALERIAGALCETTPAGAGATVAWEGPLPTADRGWSLALEEVLRTSDAVGAAIQEATGNAADVASGSYRFVVNRVLIPTINEASACVHQGLATAAEIDTVLELAATPPIGPLALADRIGLDLLLDLMDVLHQATDDPRYLPSPLLRQLVASGYLGRKSGRGFYEYEPFEP